jgi:hypothetical protein
VKAKPTLEQRPSMCVFRERDEWLANPEERQLGLCIRAQTQGHAVIYSFVYSLVLQKRHERKYRQHKRRGIKAIGKYDQIGTCSHQ